MTYQYRDMTPDQILASLNIWIYDAEVTKYNWLITAENLLTGEVFQAHNDTQSVREFLRRKDVVLGAFNNKHYDDGILMAIYYGASNAVVKELNDFIIVEKRFWWEFKYLNYKKKPFTSYDLRDELQETLSLKAIEGNNGSSIVETGVSFDIDRPWTQEELENMKEYNHVDVKETIILNNKRYDYMSAKLTIAQMKEIDPAESLGMTNAKLTARFLDAKKTKYNDEFEYSPPECLDIGEYTDVQEFFNDPVNYVLNVTEPNFQTLYGDWDKDTKAKIRAMIRKVKNEKDERTRRYSTKLFVKVADVVHVYGWGGIHGAIPNYSDQTDDTHIILSADAGSYYPSMMIVFNYLSRSVPSVLGFKDVYQKRFEAKKLGLKLVSNALKFILNTTYGAMKNQYNDLYDPRNASAICITGQLLLTDLIDKLEFVQDFKLIQSNTDGIAFKIPRSELDHVHSVIWDWEQRTEIGMEYTVIKNIAQKDVNNYVMKAGEVYTHRDGVRFVAEEDKSEIKVKGGYVSLYKGGTFENNSLVVVHKAVVDFFMKGKSVRDTVLSCTEVSEFQMIAKAGSKYGGAVHMVNGVMNEVQKVNRVYASKNKGNGAIRKIKITKGVKSYDKIAGTPDHCLIDNRGVATLNDIDLEFYIDLAESRIRDYIGKDLTLEELETFRTLIPKEVEKVENEMQTRMEDKIVAKEETVSGVTIDTEVKNLGSMNIYEKLNAMRLDWLGLEVKKSGKNKHYKFMYFELSDIVPVVQLLLKKYNMTAIVNFTAEMATLKLIDIDQVKVLDSASFDTSGINVNLLSIDFTSPMVSAEGASSNGNLMQAMGGIETYQRRYLYLIMLDIIELDDFDSITELVDELDNTDPQPQGKQSNKEKQKTDAKKPNRPVTDAEREEAKEQVIDPEGEMTEAQLKAIKVGLKKLRQSSDEHEDFITKAMTKAKGDLSKADADRVLQAIRKRLQPKEE